MQADPAQMEPFTVRIGEAHAVACPPGQSILEACLAAGVPMPYSCRSGECGECMAVLDDGRVEESPGADPAIFTDADRAKGRILTCLCTPASDLSLDVVLRDGTAAPRIERVNALVDSVERVCGSVVQVVLETPWALAYRAGQYFEWELPGISPNRNFSAANAPGTERITFDIRLYEGGQVSEHVRSSLGVGEMVELIGPFGRFGLSENDHRPAICVAGGTGLAPIKAMVEDAAARGDPRPIRLFYGARTRDDLYDMEQLDALATGHPSFSWTVALSDEPEGTGWSGFRGLVTEAMAADGLYDAFGAEAYLCGPPPMIDAATALLVEAGLDREDIFFDRFLPATARK